MVMGGGGFGFGGGGGFGNANAANRNSGLPFGGIPTELQAGVDEILKREPRHEKAAFDFSMEGSARELRQLTLWRLLSEHPGLLWWSAVLVVVVAITSQASPMLIEYAINNGMLPQHHSVHVVVVASIAYGVITLISAVAQRSQGRASARLASRVMHELRIRVFRHLQRLSLDFFTEEKAGVIMTRMTSDIENLQQLLQMGLSQFALQGLTMVVITIFLFTMNAYLAFITVVLVIPPLAAMSLWFHRASERGYDRVRDGIAGVMTHLSESLQGIRVVTTHNRQVHNAIEHRNIVGEYRDANVYTGQVNAIYGPGSQLIGYLGQAILLAIGGTMVLHHQLSIGALVAFFLYVGRFFQPIQLLVQQYNSLQQSQSSILKLRTLLETEPGVRDRPDAPEMPPIEGAIEFEHVDFGYAEHRLVLHDVELQIRPGEKVALVGPTGGGKSTIAKLITRFYDPTAGVVRLDGVDLREVQQRSVRAQLGVVPQEPFLFAGTIRDNLLFAREGITDEELIVAVERVGLAPMIERLPEGLDTFVHERGQSLSTGERQLLALCRAFLANPRVLILDEATSSLDLQSEGAVERALDVVLENRTAILIAHRLSTAERADRVVVIQGGRIVEEGSHDQLISDGGRYARMFATWEDTGESPADRSDDDDETR
jgi:ATP-binding cassette subfamily B protein